MQTNLRNWLKNQPIQNRLLVCYLISALIILFIFTPIFYFSARLYLHREMNRDLHNGAVSGGKTVDAFVNTALKDELRSSAENNLQIIIGLYQKQLSEKEAKQTAEEILSSQSIGDQGYLYVMNTMGIIQAHPQKELIGEDLSDHSHIRLQSQQKYGYLEYFWTTQESGVAQPFGLFMTYFGPWDWIITATTPTADSREIIDMESLRATLFARSFGKTGYSYILDNSGNLILHPQMEGENIFEKKDRKGQLFAQNILEQKRGRISYYWHDPALSQNRKMIAYFEHIPALDWTVVSAGYPDEYLSLLSTIGWTIFGLFLATTLIMVVITLRISRTIAQPIKYLTAGLTAVANGNFSKRLSPRFNDELGKLESYFNSIISQLEDSNAKLQNSEKGFRSIFENSVEGIFEFDMQGKIVKMNPSFVSMIGHSSSQALLARKTNFKDDLIVRQEVWGELLDLIIKERVVKGMEIQIRRKSGSVFWCLLNARGISDAEGDEIIRIEGFLSDIDATKVAREGQEKIMEQLESRVEERTMELSTRIEELELHNKLNRYMQEMADMLQSCRTIDETIPVINQYLKLLFPGDEGSLFLHDETKKMIERVVPPTSKTDNFYSMTNDSCWALRRGKQYLFKDMDQEISCDHVEDISTGYICSPLVAHGVTIGLIHVVLQQREENDPEKDREYMEQQSKLCLRLAEHLSLALANLRLQEELQRKSNQDSLTGLANRRHMEEIMQRQFYRMLRYQTPCSIIMMDVDHFKKFNDTYGHDMGDFVLQTLANYMRENTRREDLACRYGGEEFIVILVNTDTEEAVKKAEKMCREIAETITIPYLSQVLHVTVSMGVATSPAHGGNVTELIKSADTALYQAKRNGRNRVERAGSDTIEESAEKN